MNAPQNTVDQLADQLAAAHKDCWAAYHNIENDSVGYVGVRDKHADLFDKALMTADARLHLAVWDIADSLHHETSTSGVGVDGGWDRLAKRAVASIKNAVGLNHVPELSAKSYHFKIATAVIDFLDASHDAQPAYSKLRRTHMDNIVHILGDAKTQGQDVDLLLDLRRGAAVVVEALTVPATETKNADEARFWKSLYRQTGNRIAALAGPTAAPLLGLPDRPVSSGGVYSLDNPHA